MHPITHLRVQFAMPIRTTKSKPATAKKSAVKPAAKPAAAKPSRAWSTADLSRTAGCDRSSIFRAIVAGELPATRNGRRWTISHGDAMGFLRRWRKAHPGG